MVLFLKKKIIQQYVKKNRESDVFPTDTRVMMLEEGEKSDEKTHK